MRKLLLLASLVFTVYYGSSLWMFSDAASYTVVANYLPLALLVIMFIIGLLHIRIALCISTVLVLLFGNPALLNTVAVNVFQAPAGFSFFTSLGNPIESIILGVFSAWILVRFFGNPDLDYEVNRARAVRALHFPLFIFGLTAVFSALYAILASNNIFYGTFWDQVRTTLFSYPFAFFKGNNVLFPVRAVIYLLEGIAIYVMVVNEIRSARQARALVWVLLSGAVAVVIIGYLQRRWGVCYTDRVWQYNKEIQSTFSDPNTLSVFFLAMLPACVALLYRSITSKILATIFGLLLLGGIVMTATKSVILLAGIFVLVAFIVTLTKAVRGHNYLPAILLGVILLLPIIAYLVCKPLEGDSKADDLATKYVQKIDGTFGAFFTGEWSLEKLNERSSYKISDWVTAVNMVNPDSEQGRNNLLIGVGYGKFRSEYRAYQPKELSAGRNRTGASNMYLHTLAENGIFSALVLLIISLGAILYALKASDSLEHPECVKGLAVMLLLLVAGCMTENAFMHIQLQFVFWMLAGLCMVASSLAAGEGEVKGSAVLNILLLVLVLAATIWVVYPLVIEDKEDHATIAALAEQYSEPPYNIPAAKLQNSLEKTGDYNFNRNRLGRWSEKDGLIMTHVTNNILSTMLGCSHPDCSPDKPVTATVSINGVVVKQVTFEKFPEQTICEADISRISKLASLVVDQEYVLVQVSVDRTWIPAEHYPQLTNDTFDVGVNVTPIYWRDTFSPVPKPPETEPPVSPSDAVKKATGTVQDTVEDAVSAIQGTVEAAGTAVTTTTGKVKERIDSTAETTGEAVSTTTEEIPETTEEQTEPPSGDVETPFGTVKNTPAE
jgi:hypothetical protein